MSEKAKFVDSGMDIPDEAFLQIADVLLPLMQDYFESEEGKKTMIQWQKESVQKEAVPA